MKTIEKTVRMDADLARRAQRKLRRYGMTLEDALGSLLVTITVTRGSPRGIFSKPAREEPDDMLFPDAESAIFYLHAHV